MFGAFAQSQYSVSIVNVEPRNLVAACEVVLPYRVVRWSEDSH